MVPLVRLPETLSVSRGETDTRVVKRKPAALGVNPNKEVVPSPPPNSQDSTEVMEASLKSTFHNKATVIDLVSQVNDDSNKKIMIMDLSGVNLIVPDEWSRDIEGFMKCRTHKNQDGVEVPDTPTRDTQIVEVDDDLGLEPGITLDGPEEERKVNMEVSATGIGPSDPVTLAALASNIGVGPSAPVIPPGPVVRGGLSDFNTLCARNGEPSCWGRPECACDPSKHFIRSRNDDRRGGPECANDPPG